MKKETYLLKISVYINNSFKKNMIEKKKKTYIIIIIIIIIK